MANVDFGRFSQRIVQYIWDPEPTNDGSSPSPIWCLGREYSTMAEVRPALGRNATPQEEKFEIIGPQHLPQAATPPDSTTSSVDSIQNYSDSTTGEQNGGWPPPFLDDFEARIWLTYRSHFPAIPKSQDPKSLSSMSFKVRLSQLVDQGGFTSDTGWGCMIRSGQSLLANALVMLELGRDWRRGSSSLEEKRILSLFADDPEAPYSIHKFVDHGATACGKHPGEWFGPSATARCIQALTNSRETSSLRVYITGDGSDVYEDAFMNIAKPDGSNFKPTLILVGTRLGLEKITPVYWEALKASLQIPQSIGIAGGRPSSSHYFVGVQGSHFFYLDPHQTRTALPLPDSLDKYTPEDIASCHTRRLRRIQVQEMDPSMLLAFLIRDENDWKDWRESVKNVQGKAVIHVADNDPALHGLGVERDAAIDEVETFDDEDDNDTILNA